MLSPRASEVLLRSLHSLQELWGLLREWATARDQGRGSSRPGVDAIRRLAAVSLSISPTPGSSLFTEDFQSDLAGSTWLARILRFHS